MAVNVTGVPWQVGLADGDMETMTGFNGLTVMVMAFDVAGLPEAQVILDVSWHLTMSPLAGVNE